MCRVLEDCLQDGIAAKLADDLYCGADTPKKAVTELAASPRCPPALQSSPVSRKFGGGDKKPRSKSVLVSTVLGIDPLIHQ